MKKSAESDPTQDDILKAVLRGENPAIPEGWLAEEYDHNIDIAVDLSMQERHIKEETNAEVGFLKRWETKLVNQRSRRMKQLKIDWNNRLAKSADIQANTTIVIAILTGVLIVVTAINIFTTCASQDSSPDPTVSQTEAPQ